MLRLRNIHPGEVLRLEFMQPFGFDGARLASLSGIPPDTIREVLAGRARIEAAMAISLSEVFGARERFWLGLQNDYDLEEAYRLRAIERRDAG